MSRLVEAKREVEEKVDSSKLVEWVSGYENPNIVKKTVSWISNSATPYIRTPIRATSHMASKRRVIFDTIVEGEFIDVCQMKSTVSNFEIMCEGLNKELMREKGQFELILMLSPRGEKFGVVLTDYFSPSGWINEKG